ncbi:MAG: zinc ribbon domain-containing protein, partial [Acidobacteria bacterium]|nr:zinc ribbon domain-containing protein [Acidobacteriota bacterium]
MQCSNCGNPLQPGMKFCTKCGALNAAAPQPTPQPTPPPAAATPGVSFGDAPRAPLHGSAMGQPPRKSGCGKVLLVLAVIGVVGLVGIGVAG